MSGKVSILGCIEKETHLSWCYHPCFCFCFFFLCSADVWHLNVSTQMSPCVDFGYFIFSFFKRFLILSYVALFFLQASLVTLFLCPPIWLAWELLIWNTCFCHCAVCHLKSGIQTLNLDTSLFRTRTTELWTCGFCSLLKPFSSEEDCAFLSHWRAYNVKRLYRKCQVQ